MLHVLKCWDESLPGFWQIPAIDGEITVAFRSQGLLILKPDDGWIWIGFDLYQKGVTFVQFCKYGLIQIGVESHKAMLWVRKGELKRHKWIYIIIFIILYHNVS